MQPEFIGDNALKKIMYIFVTIAHTMRETNATDFHKHMFLFGCAARITSCAGLSWYCRTAKLNFDFWNSISCATFSSLEEI